jgi:hypothetical protein
MNINELESYKLSDAIKFRTELNPMLFNDERMASDVREKLLEISNEFIDYLGINNLDIDDITLSGSNAAYTYTDHSDIDLHILVDMNKINNDDIYRELFTAKKNLFNADHDIKIRGYDVELYVQDKNQSVKSLGEYSILNDKWIKFPRKQRASIDQNSVKNKVTKLVQMAEIANRSNNIDQIDKVLSTIKRYRQSGLDKHGEFGPENIAFKILRTNGIIDKLYNHRNRLYSIQLSLDEENLLEASGYIPSESEKNDSRFKTALTVDIHPDTMKKNAAKLGWKIARNGRPPLLMKEDIVDEWSQTDPGIRKALEEKGYKFLDNGVDQSAYIEPGTGWILKIFGTQHNSKFEGTPTFSKDHQMFFKWAKFCMKNSDNPFLPQFGGYESFEWKGKTYLQIRQEQLKSVNNNVGELLEALADIVSSYGNNFTWDRFCMKFDDDLKDEEYQYSKRLVKMLGGDLQKAKLFYETLKSLHDISEKQRSYIWDMHKGNFMMRGKTPVIVDPWVVRKN